MGPRTFSLLVAALLVSLFTHRLPVSCAPHGEFLFLLKYLLYLGLALIRCYAYILTVFLAVAVLKVNNGLDNRGNMVSENFQSISAFKQYRSAKGSLDLSECFDPLFAEPR
jgi:hypothetical protein